MITIFVEETNKTDKMETQIENSKIELNEQILFSQNQGLFVGRIVKMSEKAVKVDYCWESVWGSASAMTVFTYTTWIPKSVIINDKIGGLTVKAWFCNSGLKSDNTYHIKKYFVKNNEVIYL